MPDWEELLKKAKDDVTSAVDVWSDILPDTFGSRLEYAYVKGSALKEWDSFIDYVPILSDVDIHIMLTDSEDLFPGTRQGFYSSIDVTIAYEKGFREIRPDHLHIPRMQVMHINPNLGKFTLPMVSDVHVMIGSPKDGRVPTNEDVRSRDYVELQELDEYLKDLPRQTFDRVGLDFWALLRRMCWRVSPSPVRLLTQTHNSPLDVWKWNRTKIVQELRKNEFETIAESYERYYIAGWRLFLSDFTSSEELRKTIVEGYNVLQGCIREVKQTPVDD